MQKDDRLLFINETIKVEELEHQDSNIIMRFVVKFNLLCYLVAFQITKCSCHNGFSLDLDNHKKLNEVATDLFCTGVIGHPGSMFLN